MKKLVILIFILTVLTAGCADQENSATGNEIPESVDVEEDLSVAELDQESAIEIEPESNNSGNGTNFTADEVEKIVVKSGNETNSTENEVEKASLETSASSYRAIFPKKTIVKLNNETAYRAGDSYLGRNEGKVYHFYPEKAGITGHTSIIVEDGLHVLKPEGVFFLENDTATIYSNESVKKSKFPCDWNPASHRPSSKARFNMYVPYLTANFTDSEYWIEENKIYVPEKGNIFLYNGEITVYIENGTEMEDDGYYFMLYTENTLSQITVFDRFVITENVSIIRCEGETYLPEMFEN